MTHLQRIFAGMIVLIGAPLWAQVSNPPAEGLPATLGTSDVNSPTPPVDSDRMQTPPPVSGQTYPTEFTSEERSNYLLGGLTFITAYTDNALGGIQGTPISDVSYSVAPQIALDETTPRMHFEMQYAPGFTFYQKVSSRNEQDQNAAVDFEYRLSPHVTFSARDGFQKSSNVFNQPGLISTTGVAGGIQDANMSVIAPIADRLSNVGNVGLVYQFALNEMVGVNGTFVNLHYPDQSEVPGLFDSSSQAGLAFYSLRVSKINYFGITYQYQRLLAYPATGTAETQTDAALLFYTVYPTPKFSLSFFAGPEHSDTTQPSLSSPLRQWTPAGGASVSWQGRLNTLAASYVHLIAGGGGLVGAVQSDSGSASLRQQIARTLSGSIAGSYAQNNLLVPSTTFSVNGHSISATASLQQEFGKHVIAQLGYTRLHQDYSTVALLSTFPNTNREFVSLSYLFSKALGR
jgi:hypothetical protein